MKLNTHNAKTLANLFAKPSPRNLEWNNIETLFVAVGCKVIEGSGSRVRFGYGPVVAMFHRPHPQTVAKRYQIEDARAFLEKIGVSP